MKVELGGDSMQLQRAYLGSSSLWLVGGEDGWFGGHDSSDNDIASRSPNWQSLAPDIVSLDGQLASVDGLPKWPPHVLSIRGVGQCQ